MRTLRSFVLAVPLVLAAALAHAQSPCAVTQSQPPISGGGSVFSAIVSQWKQFFGAKVDANNGMACGLNLINPIINGNPLVYSAVAPLTLTAGVLTLSYNNTEFTVSGGALTLNAVPASLLTGSALPSNITSAAGLLSAAGGTFGTAAFVNTGTSGGTLGLLNGNLTFSGANNYGTPSAIVLTNGSGLPTSGLAGPFTGTGSIVLSANAALTGTPTVNTYAIAAKGSGTFTNGHCVDIDSNGNFIDAGAACSSGGGGGSVTSVGLSVPGLSIFGVTGSPITTAGTIGLTTTGTSGGVLYFSSTSQVASSGLLAANALVIGGGAGAPPTTATTGSGVLTALSNTAGGTGGFALQSGLAAYLPLAGGTMSGNVAMATHNITGAGAVTAGTLALNGATLGSNSLATNGLALFQGGANNSGNTVTVANRTRTDLQAALWLENDISAQDVWFGTNGRVGVGTDSPGAPLDVEYSLDGSQMIYFGKATSNDAGFGTAAVEAINGPYSVAQVVPSNVRAALMGIGTFSGTTPVAGNIEPGIFGYVPAGGHGSAALAGLFGRGDTNQEVILGGNHTAGLSSLPIIVWDTSLSQTVFQVAANGAVTGSGAFNFVSGAQRSMATTLSLFSAVIGSSGSPNTSGGLATVIGEVIGATNSVAAIVPAVYGMGIKTSSQTGNSYHVNGGYFGAEDDGGWSGTVGGSNNNFVEGVRSEALVTAALGSPYGIVSVAAGNVGIRPLYMIGSESEVDNKYADAITSFSPSTFTAAYVATNGNGDPTNNKVADAAFLANPFSDKWFLRDFFAPRRQASGSSATYAQFEGQDTSTWGLQLEFAITSSAIGIPNNSAVRGCRQFSSTVCDNGDMNLMFVGTDNTVHFGPDAALAKVILASNGVTTQVLGMIELDGFLTGAGNKVILPNNVALEGENVGGTAALNMLYVATDNTGRLATDASLAGVIIGKSSAMTVINGVYIGNPAGGDEGVGTLNIGGPYYDAGSAGVTCNPGPPSSSFSTAGGIVTHC